jgi:prevent-host-death family protein
VRGAVPAAGAGCCRFESGGAALRLVDLTSRAEVDMREVQASEAKTHLPRLLDEVERGETIVTTRHGRPIARIVPEVDRRRADVEQAVQNLLALRERLAGRVTLAELLDARHEGHKY